MIQYYRSTLIILAVILFSGCLPLPFYGGVIWVGGGPFPGRSNASLTRQELIPETSLKSNELDSVKTIAMFEIPDPPNYGDDTAEFEGFSFGNTTQAFLKQFLEENGYEVIGVFDGTSADAYLEVAPVRVEYKQNILDHEFRPNVSVVVRFVSADTDKVIYAGSVQYGWDINSPVSGIEIESPKEHKYESHKALKARKKEAMERLVYGVEAVSLHIVKKISKGEFVSIMGTPVESNLSDNDNMASMEFVEIAGEERIYTGSYRSKITGRLGKSININNSRVLLVQNGKSITGTFGKGGKIWGDVEENTITFSWFLNGNDGSGKWTFDRESHKVVGSWFSSYLGDGSWNLSTD